MHYSIGIDLGGTNIKAVAVTATGEILARMSKETSDAASEKPLWADRVKEIIASFQANRQFTAQHIGLCAPGLASRDGRSIVSMPGRMAGLEGLDWTTFLQQKTVVPVLNDAQAALLGEVWQGAGKGVSDAVLLTLGTGVGGAIYADGRLLRGNIGRAGHLGHICLNVNGPPDSVGIPGSLEDAIAEKTINLRSSGRFTSTREMVSAMVKGDQDADFVWNQSIKALASAIASLINAIDPEVVIIGGGIAKAGDILFEPLNTWLNKFEWRPEGRRVRIVPAKLDEWSGAIGAAHHAMTTQTKHSEFVTAPPPNVMHGVTPTKPVDTIGNLV